MAQQKHKSFLIEPTVDTSAYADGDAIDGLQTLSQALREALLSGRIDTVTVIDQAKQSPALELYFFESQVTGGTDNAAYNPSDANIAECLAVVKVVAGDYNTTSAQAVATVKPDFAVQAASGDGTLYMQIVSGGAPTFGAATELKLRVVISQD